MLIANEGALNELRRFGRAFSGMKRPDFGVLREALSKMGRVHLVEPERPRRPVVAVDGSYQTVGTAYPYLLTLIQAVALPVSSCGKPLIGHRLFTPLFPEEQAELEMRASDQESIEKAAESRVRELMAEVELTVACQAAAKHKGALVLLDGGFIHFRARGGSLFDQLVEKITWNECLLIGVIEEISSRMLGTSADGLWEKGAPVHDREILYGCLAVGEAFVVSRAVRKDEQIGTVFARFAAHPQPVGFDYLAAQEEKVLQALGELRALTPLDGRGVPAAIDIADRYVRLTAAEVEQLVAATVPAAVQEFFLRAHRLRRTI